MTASPDPTIEFQQAKRAALLCLAHPEYYAPAYLQLAVERMLNALVKMAPLQLASGGSLAGLVEDDTLQTLLQKRLEREARLSA